MESLLVCLPNPLLTTPAAISTEIVYTPGMLLRFGSRAIAAQAITFTFLHQTISNV